MLLVTSEVFLRIKISTIKEDLRLSGLYFARYLTGMAVWD